MVKSLAYPRNALPLALGAVVFLATACGSDKGSSKPAAASPAATSPAPQSSANQLPRASTNATVNDSQLPATNQSLAAVLGAPVTINLEDGKIPPGAIGAAASSPSLALAGGCPAYNIVAGALHIASLGACDAPALINLHGGGWCQGEASDMDGWFGVPEVMSGIVYISLEYTDCADMSVIAQQVDLAFTIIRANAGILSVDPSRVGVIGFSAGGHLALLEAVSNHAVRWAGSLSGPTDVAEVFNQMVNVATHSTGDTQASAVQIAQDILQVMGGWPQAIPQKYAQYSPINGYHGLAGSGANTAFFLANATDDEIVPWDQIQSFVAGVQAIGGNIALQPLTGGHFASINAIQESIANFLSSTPSSYHP